MICFYQKPHPFYCGIDLHARTMHVCILDAAGCVRDDQNPRDLAPRLPLRRAGTERRPLAGVDRDALNRRRGERTIFEGAGAWICSRQAQAKGQPAWTLIRCLVQPSGCNPVWKKAVQTKWHRSADSERNDLSEEKTLQDSAVRPLDFRGHLTGVPPSAAPTARERKRQRILHRHALLRYGLFGRHIAGGAHYGTRLGQVAFAEHILRQPKVSDLGSSVRSE
jgi:hypothetical protein